MKNHSLFGYGHRIFCAVLVGCALISTRSAFAHSPLGSISNHFIIQQQVTGTVSDASGVLAGVTVSVKGTAIAALTDAAGRYAISASKGDVLVFSFLGYSPLEMAVSGTVLNAILVPDAQSLQEVVVNAGYYSVKEKERTGSIAKISAKDIETQPVSNVLAAMQGRMAGVNITQSTGVPGGGFSVQIRGRNSIRTEGNNPLYIVDGMPFSSETLGNSAVSASILPGSMSPLNSLNPTDIESIEVLKDADATAIYGARGANGVVLITTKKGKAGKTRFTADSYSGIGMVSRRLDLMNTEQYLAMREEAFANDGITAYPASAHDLNGNWDRNRYTDWQEELIGGTARMQQASASVSGGSAQTQFSASGTRYKETTVFPGDFSYKKTAGHASITHASEDSRFHFSLSASYVADRNDLLSTDLTRDAVNLAPNAPELYAADGSLNWQNGTWNNPLRLLQGSYLARTSGLTAGSTLSWELLPGLEARAMLGYAESHVEESRTTPSTVYNPSLGLTPSVSTLLSSRAGQQSWSAEPQLSWRHDIGRSRVQLLAGSTLQERNATSLALSVSGFSSNSLIHNAAAGANRQVTGNAATAYRYAAFFGRANYSFDGKYFLNFTGRRDGSSRFGPGNRFANFGAVGAAWLFSKESWVEKNAAVLSFGKLRGSYGTTGSDQIGDYQYLNSYTALSDSYQGVVGLSPVRLYNPDFSWESSKKLEAALELGFFSDRILLTGAWYRNRSSNQLTGIPLPGTTGFESVQANLAATVENSGWELELRTENLRGSGFRWSTAVNISIAKNKLAAFPGLEGSTYATQLVIGQPLGIRQVYAFEGVDPQTGRYRFTDFNGDGLLTAAEDRKKLVDTSPDYFGGIQNSVKLGQWALDFLFQFVKQQGINSRAVSSMPGLANNQPVSSLGRWQQPGDAAANAAYTAGYTAAALSAFQNQFLFSDAVYSDASYVRLKNLSVSYTLPKSWTGGAGCRLYAEGQNLLTFTHFDGPDPENQAQGRLAPLRVMTLGISLQF